MTTPGSRKECATTDDRALRVAALAELRRQERLPRELHDIARIYRALMWGAVEPGGDA